MSTAHFVDAQGVYLGGFGDGAVPPEGAVEVAAPPHGLATWQGGAWVLPPPAVPAQVSRFQARAALHLAGLLPQVEAQIAAADVLTQIAWADAQEFERASPTIAALALTLGLSSAQVDALFVTAAGITA